MTNRCDSVDALMYAYCDFMRIKEENQMLEKDKNCIEFSMRSMMATYKPYQEDTEIAIEGMAPGKNLLLANNPFDIPCDVVVVSKSYFDRLQTENEQLKKKLEELHNQLIWTGDELGRANSSNNSWKATAECNSPKELMEKLNLLRDNIEEWKEATSYPNPSSAKTAIESGASWCIAYNQVKKKYDQSIEIIGEWQRVTGHFSPKAADEELASLKKEVSEYKEQIKSLYKVIESWNNVTGFSTPEKCSSYIDTLERDCKEAIKKCKKWGEVTGFKTPEDAKDYWTAKLSESGEVSESLAMEVRSWKKATGCDTPEEANKKLASYEGRLDSVKQSASIAIRHLDNIVFRDDKCTDWSDK